MELNVKVDNWPMSPPTVAPPTIASPMVDTSGDDAPYLCASNNDSSYDGASNDWASMVPPAMASYNGRFL